MHEINWQPKFVQADGVRLAYYEWGQGEPLVLLHGNGADSTCFRNQIPVFSRLYRVIAVDSRGHGRSELGDEGLNFAQMADDLYAVFQTLGLKKAHVLGFSDGGNLAICFALQYPQCVDKLILNGANIRMLTGIKPYIQLPVYPAVGLLHLLSPLDRSIRRKYDVLSLMAHEYGVDWDDLRRIQVPTLVLVGEHDMVYDKHSWRMTLCLPHARMVRIAGGDHFIAEKMPNQFNLAVLRFLKGGDAW